MAIGYNTCASGAVPTWGTTITYSHTCGVQPNRIMVVTTTAGTVTYAGVPLTRIPSLSYAWYLVNPASGANNVVAEWAGATRDPCVSADFYGVDQVTPIRHSAQASAASVTTVSVSISCAVSDMLVGMFYRDTGDGCGNVAAQSPLTNPYDCCRNSTSTVGLIPHTFLSHGLASTSPQTITALIADSRNNGIWMGTSLRPYVPALGRQVKYYFNVWDPRAQIRDRNDRVVPPNELTPDSWIEVQGHILPDALAYSTYITDPTKARIVEVNATEKGATMRANRSQFADVLMSRASAGRA